MTGCKHILGLIGVGCLAVLTATTHCYADTWVSLTPPGYSIPEVAFPFPEPGSAERSSRLDFAGENRVIHTVNFDRSPRRWADGLLTVRVGQATPWNLADSYALFPFGLRGTENRAAALLAGELILFNRSPVGTPGEPIRSALHDNYTLNQADDELVVTKAQDRRWYFEPVNFGAGWRLSRMELVRFHDQMITLEYGDHGLVAIRYPNDESVVFEYEDGLPVRIALPFDEEVRLSRDSAGFITEMTLLRSSHANSERGILKRFEYDRINSEAGLSGARLPGAGGIGRFVNERGIEFTVVYDQSEGDSAERTTLVQNSVDRSFAFRHTESTGRPSRRLVIDGFGDRRTPVQEAIEAYRPWARELTPVSLSSLGSVASLPQSRLPFAPTVRGADLGWRGTYRVYASANPGKRRGAIAQAPVRLVGSGLEDSYRQRFQSYGWVTPTNAESGQDASSISHTHRHSNNLIETRINDNLYRFVYDLWGRIVQQVRPDGVQTHWQFDDTGYLVAIEVRIPVRQNDEEVFATDEFNTVTTLFERDHLGRITQVTHPNGGGDRFQFDPRGNLLTWSPAEGGAQQRMRYGYDRLGRLIRVERPGNVDVPREEFVYHAGDAVSSHEVVRRAERRNERDQYEYNPQGQLIAESIARLGRTQYGYDDRGRRHHVIHPDGTESLYTFDDLNRIVTIRGSHQPPVDLAYDENGQRTVTPGNPASPGNPENSVPESSGARNAALAKDAALRSQP